MTTRPLASVRRQRLARVVSLAGVMTMSLTFVHPSASNTASAETSLDNTDAELVGSGAWSVTNHMLVYSTAMYNSPGQTLLSYIPKGDRDGRHVFAEGDADFVISGRPLSADDNAKLAERKVTTVSAPFSAGSLAFFMSGAYPGGLEVYTPHPTDPEENGTRTPYTGALRMPNTTLANIFADRGIINNWYDPPFVAANKDSLPAGSFFAPIINGTIPVVRSDPSAENFYLQKFVATVAPSEFITKIAEEKLEAFEIGENWPFLTTASRTGSVGVANLVAGGQNPKEGVVAYGGVITATPTSDALIQKANFPDAQVFVAAMQNGAGEWIQPTPESISLGIDALGANAGAANGDLPALTTAVPGAYPLVWINNITAPTTGLSASKANRLATLMRVSALTSKAVGASIGEGGLSETLVAQALTAADQVVVGNCTMSGYSVVTNADGGSAWPNELAKPPMPVKTCAKTTSGSSASTAAPTTASSSSSANPSASVLSGSADTDTYVGGFFSPSAGSGSDDSVYSSDYSASLSDLDTYDLAASAGAALSGMNGASAQGLASTGSNAPGAVTLAAAQLPLGLPDDGRGHLDRLSTLLLGGVMVLTGRSLTKGRSTTRTQGGAR